MLRGRQLVDISATISHCSVSRASSVAISCLYSPKNLRRALHLARVASHHITSALKWPLDSRVVTLRVFDFRWPLSSSSEALPEPSGELGRVVTGRLAMSFFVSRGCLFGFRRYSTSSSVVLIEPVEDLGWELAGRVGVTSVSSSESKPRKITNGSSN